MKIKLPRLAAGLALLFVQPAVAGSTVSGEHSQIGIVDTGPSNQHTRHPDAQWFPDAGLGLFIHWDEGSVAGLKPGNYAARLLGQDQALPVDFTNQLATITIPSIPTANTVQVLKISRAPNLSLPKN